jgi:hypothetical protein
MVIGDADIWSDTFPEELIPRLLDLITNTWGTFVKPGPSEHEVPITRRFKHALKQAKDLRRLPVRIEREPAEDHPLTGQELGRIDLKFLPAVSALEEVYFAFECKRLNASENGVRRTLAPEYVTEGMMRFVTGQYASAVYNGGMIGYVLDGRPEEAIRLVEQNIVSRTVELGMTPPAALGRSTVRPDNPFVRETGHSLQSVRLFRLHHAFLECGGDVKSTSAGAAEPKPNRKSDSKPRRRKTFTMKSSAHE